MNISAQKISCLADLPSGKQATIRSFSQNLDCATLQRLNDLGVSVERNIRCVRHLPFQGPLSIAVDGLILAIENDVAKQINIEEI